jgi:hypothetical protein
MGLDCYFCSLEPISFPENGLLGELNSFRGRKCAPFVAALTGYDLSQETLDATAVEQIAVALRQRLAHCREHTTPETLVWRSSEGRYCDIFLHQLQQLVIVFDFAAAQGLSLFNHS